MLTDYMEHVVQITKLKKRVEAICYTATHSMSTNICKSESFHVTHLSHLLASHLDPEHQTQRVLWRVWTARSPLWCLSERLQLANGKMAILPRGRWCFYHSVYFISHFPFYYIADYGSDHYFVLSHQGWQWLLFWRKRSLPCCCGRCQRQSWLLLWRALWIKDSLK